MRDEIKYRESITSERVQQSFNDTEIKLYNFLVESFPDNIIHTGADQYNEDMLTLLATLAKLLGEPKELINNLSNAKSVEELTKKDDTPSGKLLYLLAKEIGFNHLSDVSIDEQIKELIKRKPFLERYYPMIKNRGSLLAISMLMDALFEYIKQEDSERQELEYTIYEEGSTVTIQLNQLLPEFVDLSNPQLVEHPITGGSVMAIREDSFLHQLLIEIKPAGVIYTIVAGVFIDYLSNMESGRVIADLVYSGSNQKEFNDKYRIQQALTLDYDLNGGTMVEGNLPSKETYVDDVKVKLFSSGAESGYVLTPNVERKGTVIDNIHEYDLTGWETQYQSTPISKTNQRKTLNRNTTLKAAWSKKPIKTVSYLFGTTEELPKGPPSSSIPGGEIENRYFEGYIENNAFRVPKTSDTGVGELPTINDWKVKAWYLPTSKSTVALNEAKTFTGTALNNPIIYQAEWENNTPTSAPTISLNGSVIIRQSLIENIRDGVIGVKYWADIPWRFTYTDIEPSKLSSYNYPGGTIESSDTYEPKGTNLDITQEIIQENDLTKPTQPARARATAEWRTQSTEKLYVLDPHNTPTTGAVVLPKTSYHRPKPGDSPRYFERSYALLPNGSDATFINIAKFPFVYRHWERGAMIYRIGGRDTYIGNSDGKTYVFKGSEVTQRGYFTTVTAPMQGGGSTLVTQVGDRESTDKAPQSSLGGSSSGTAAPIVPSVDAVVERTVLSLENPPTFSKFGVFYRGNYTVVRDNTDSVKGLRTAAVTIGYWYDYHTPLTQYNTNILDTWHGDTPVDFKEVSMSSSTRFDYEENYDNATNFGTRSYYKVHEFEPGSAERMEEAESSIINMPMFNIKAFDENGELITEESGVTKIEIRDYVHGDGEDAGIKTAYFTVKGQRKSAASLGIENAQKVTFESDATFTFAIAEEADQLVNNRFGEDTGNTGEITSYYPGVVRLYKDGVYNGGGQAWDEYMSIVPNMPYFIKP